MSRRALLAVTLLAVVLVPGAARGQSMRLVATVGPGYTIELVDAGGQPVSKLDPGTYEITVRDLSDEHNFHLYGPGVDRTTTVAGTGTVSWTVTFRDGRYSFVCDPHATMMRGDFVAGNPPPPPPTTPPPATPKPRALTATVGPGATIALRTPAGAAVRTLTAGAYVLTVRDLTKAHNLHLVAPGVNRRTTVAGTGTVTWRLTLRRGTLALFSDRAPTRLRRTFAVR